MPCFVFIFLGAPYVERLRDNAIEAAEQCGATFVPQIDEVQPLDRLLQRADVAIEGAGESALFMAEQLAFEQVRRKRRAKDSHRPMRSSSSASLCGSRSARRNQACIEWATSWA